MLHHTGTTCSSLSPATIIWKMGKLIATLTWTWTEGGKWNSWYLNNFMIFFCFSWENDWENWKSFLKWQKILKNLKMLFQPLHGDRVLRIAWHISHNSEGAFACACKSPIIRVKPAWCADAIWQLLPVSLPTSNIFKYFWIYRYIRHYLNIIKVDRNLRQTPCWIQHFTIWIP